MNNELKSLSPFKRLCIAVGNLPTAYIESMSYYEGLTFLVNYLSNNVIPVVNNNSEVTKEIQEQFVILKNYVDNYFNNLDVQEEINNKLDEMASSGQLTDIIAQYLGLAGMITFDTVADMKLAENLVNGSKCQTLGYNSVNDGGHSLYKVRTVTNEDVIDEMYIIALYDNSLVAELIHSDIINVKQMGATGDGVTDDTTILQYCLDKSINGTVYIPDGEYLISSTLNFKCNIIMEQNARILTNNSSISYLMKFNTINPATSLSELVKGKMIKGGILDGKGIANNLLGVASYMGLTIQDVRFENPKEFGLITRVNGNLSAELLVNNCYFYNDYTLYPNKPTGIFNNGSDNVFTNITMFNMFIGVHTYTGYFEYIHPWISDKNLIEGSIAFKCNGNVSLICCMADTYEKSFNLLNVHNYRLLNCSIYYNTVVYDSSISDTHKPYAIYTESENVNIYTENLQINNNISGSYFINRISKGSYNNTIFTGSENVNKTNYIKDSFHNQIASLTEGQDIRELDTGSYSIQNISLTNFVPGLSGVYGELLVFKNRVFTIIIFCQHNSSSDMYYCIGANGGVWRNWRQITGTTEITS